MFFFQSFDSILEKYPGYEAALVGQPLTMTSDFKDIYLAVRKGVDFKELWHDLKSHPGRYANAAMTTVALSTYAGAKRAGFWGAAAGSVTN